MKIEVLHANDQGLCVRREIDPVEHELREAACPSLTTRILGWGGMDGVCVIMHGIWRGEYLVPMRVWRKLRNSLT